MDNLSLEQYEINGALSAMNWLRAEAAKYSAIAARYGEEPKEGKAQITDDARHELEVTSLIIEQILSHGLEEVENDLRAGRVSY